MNTIKSLFIYTLTSMLLISVSLVIALVYNTQISQSAQVSISFQRRTAVLDPGHGGKDGGAISVTGSTEKELNFSVSIALRDVLTVLGYDVIMTRDSDVELTHADGGTRKMQDLKGRLEILSQHQEAPFISIHMNKFPISKYSGAQIYYTVNNDQGLQLAKTVRSSIIDLLQTDNERNTKPSNSSIYLLHKAKSPAILIECGFLSNDEEAKLLDDDIYQIKLASVIASGINMWYNGYHL